MHHGGALGQAGKYSGPQTPCQAARLWAGVASPAPPSRLRALRPCTASWQARLFSRRALRASAGLPSSFWALPAFAGLSARLGGRGQPELFFGAVLAGSRQGAGRARLDQPGHEMPLTALAGPDTAHSGHVQRQAAGAVGLALAAKGVVHIAQGVRQREVRVALQEGRHLALILFRGERTGGIDQLPARGQHRRRAVQNVRAQLGALLHQRLAVLGHRGRLFAEHSLAGAGGVHQHPVKKLRQSLRNAGRGLVQDDRIGHAHPLEIALEDVGPGSHILIADKQPLPRRAAASWLLLPPGAAHRSSTRIPGLTPSSGAADAAEGSCE